MEYRHAENRWEYERCGRKEVERGRNQEKGEKAWVVVNDGCGGGGGNNKRQGSNEETTRREQSVYPRPVELPITLEVVVIVKKIPTPISWDRSSFLF